MLVLMILMIFSSGIHAQTFTGIHFVFALLTGLAYFHYRAAIEVEQGSETGKAMSQIIGCLFLIGFPIGTCIGILILLNVRKGKWQSGRDLSADAH